MQVNHSMAISPNPGTQVNQAGDQQNPNKNINLLMLLHFKAFPLDKQIQEAKKKPFFSLEEVQLEEEEVKKYLDLFNKTIGNWQLSTKAVEDILTLDNKQLMSSGALTQEQKLALRDLITIISSPLLQKEQYDNKYNFLLGHLYEALGKNQEAAARYCQIASNYSKRGNQKAAQDYYLKTLSMGKSVYLTALEIQSLPENIQAKRSLIRIAFEKQLDLINLRAPKEGPLSFICYAKNKNDQSLRDWIVKQLLPDLDRAGVRGLFDQREVGPGCGLIDFSRKICECDNVVLICDPVLKKRKEAWDKEAIPSTEATEIQLLEARLSKGKKLWDTILPILYQGDWETARPSIFLHRNPYIDFRSPENYFESCLGLCVKLMLGEENLASYIDSFRLSVEEIIKAEVTNEDREAIAFWDEKRKNERLWLPILSAERASIKKEKEENRSVIF